MWPHLRVDASSPPPLSLLLLRILRILPIVDVLTALCPVTCRARYPAVWNDTMDVDYGRPINIMFLERLLASEYRTANPEEADYFFLPMVGGVKSLPREMSKQPWERMGNRLDGVRYVKRHPVYRKYWHRRGGRDHFAIGCDDAGARAYWHGGAAQTCTGYTTVNERV